MTVRQRLVMAYFTLEPRRREDFYDMEDELNE